MRNKVGVWDGVNYRAVCLFGHEDENENEYDRYGHSDDRVHFRVRRASTGQTPNHTEGYGNYDYECSYADSCYSTTWSLAICCYY